MATKLKVPSAAKAKKYFQDKMAFTTGPVELERWFKQGEPVNIVDVRAAEDYAEGHIPGALNLPKGQWGDAKVVRARLHKKRSTHSIATRTSVIWRQRRRSCSRTRAVR
jgi:3-mercaptopyruvate sulfurtransferase SseA